MVSQAATKDIVINKPWPPFTIHFSGGWTLRDTLPTLLLVLIGHLLWPYIRALTLDLGIRNILLVLFAVQIALLIYSIRHYQQRSEAAERRFQELSNTHKAALQEVTIHKNGFEKLKRVCEDCEEAIAALKGQNEEEDRQWLLDDMINSCESRIEDLDFCIAALEQHRTAAAGSVGLVSPARSTPKGTRRPVRRTTNQTPTLADTISTLKARKKRTERMRTLMENIAAQTAEGGSSDEEFSKMIKVGMREIDDDEEEGNGVGEGGAGVFADVDGLAVDLKRQFASLDRYFKGRREKLRKFEERGDEPAGEGPGSASERNA